MNLEQQIDEQIGEVRTESLDLSFGEIVNMRKDGELVIQPEYQRLFRWSSEQKSRLIESILLELPIPQIFVIENDDGVFELIDGLQRISSVLQFLDHEVIELEPLELEGCELISALNKLKFEDLPLTLRLRIKRSTVRTIVIKRQSKSFLRYEMFKRLNTGGSLLSAQEIRNCSSRMVGDEGIKLYSFIQSLAENSAFLTTTQSLASQDADQKGDEELVLRFFATKNFRSEFRGSVRDWLDNFMESILLERIDFDQDIEGETFRDVFETIESKLGETAFVKFRGDKPVGGLAPAYFEAVAIGSFDALTELKASSPESARTAIAEVVQSDEFRQVTGPGANSKSKLESRIQLVANAIRQL